MHTLSSQLGQDRKSQGRLKAAVCPEGGNVLNCDRCGNTTIATPSSHENWCMTSTKIRKLHAGVWPPLTCCWVARSLSCSRNADAHCFRLSESHLKVSLKAFIDKNLSEEPYEACCNWLQLALLNTSVVQPHCAEAREGYDLTWNKTNRIRRAAVWS